ncbi:endocuticle structural protein SgAbd-6 [Pieris rapae]|uniref:endocuticle structural protein SgAbd-6 n=1 Tax=Pieris rapae TaxID=64459 RepID=UPI001E27D782|nr:endocuticle structural protein SgAbd-6 [Pieris rapae]
MRQIIVLAFVIAVVAGAAVPTGETRRDYYSPAQAQILRYDVDNIGLGNYKYAYEQTDGTRQEQQGAITNEGREDEAIAVKGSFSWVAPNGVRYTVTYTSDVDGYKPTLEEGPGGLPDVALISALG